MGNPEYKEYGVEVRETLSRSVTVSEKSLTNAFENVRKQYNEEKIVLGPEDLEDVVFVAEEDGCEYTYSPTEKYHRLYDRLCCGEENFEQKDMDGVGQHGSDYTEYEIEIRETLSRIVSVNAKSLDEAFKKVDKQYREEKIVLGAEDFTEVAFDANANGYFQLCFDRQENPTPLQDEIARAVDYHASRSEKVAHKQARKGR